jgi:hypothetical protein
MKATLALTLTLTLLCSTAVNCSKPEHRTSLIYFGFDNRLEKPEDVIQLAKTWSNNPPCPSWRATIDQKAADYQVLFGITDVSIINRRGEILYSGGQGVLYLPHGNRDGSGVNICKLTGE